MTTILVVDDSKVDQRLVGGLLEKNERLTIAYADNGAEALERMTRVLPDLIVTDLQMPEMDGLELVTYTRERFPGVPVVVALEEALINALYHGNLELTSEELAEFRSRLLESDLDPVEERRALEPYASRHIHVEGKINDREARIVIRDEGPGFDISTV